MPDVGPGPVRTGGVELRGDKGRNVPHDVIAVCFVCVHSHCHFVLCILSGKCFDSTLFTSCQAISFSGVSMVFHNSIRVRGRIQWSTTSIQNHLLTSSTQMHILLIHLLPNPGKENFPVGHRFSTRLLRIGRRADSMTCISLQLLVVCIIWGLPGVAPNCCVWTRPK